MDSPDEGVEQGGAPARDVLAAVVAEVFPGATVRGTRPLAGGLSSAMDVVDVAGGDVASVVLRRLPTEWGDAIATATRECRGHELAAAGGVPAPEVLWADTAGERFGRPALLLPFVPGRPIVADLARVDAAEAFADAVVAVGSVRRGHDTTLPRLRDHAAHRALFGGPSTASPVVDASALLDAVGRLAQHADRADDLLHADLHGGNVLWDGVAVTAVLDWPGASWGVRWYDEAHAVADTEFAHGRDAGERLHAALRERHASGPTEQASALWRGAALVRALPSPAGWLDGYLGTGCEVTADELDERFVAAVERWLDVHG